MSATTIQTIACPCCGEDMDSDNVVCWRCYRETDRLTPGTYRDTYVRGAIEHFTITREDVARYQAMRDERMGITHDGPSYVCRECSETVRADEYGSLGAFCRDAGTDGPCPSCYVKHAH